MVELNEKALSAGAEALARMYHGESDEPFHHMAKSAITAYLATLPAEVVFCPNCGWNSAMDGEALPAPDGLVERLRYRVENPSAWDTFDQGGSDLIAEAATALLYKDERIERLEEALRLHNAWDFPSDIQSMTIQLESAEQQVQKLSAENERLREALEPLGALAAAVFRTDDGREMNAQKADGAAVWGFDQVELTYGHLRAARSALETKEGGE